jgi:hypothetical protein
LGKSDLGVEPEGLIEKVGDKLNIVENQAEADLERFQGVHWVGALCDWCVAWIGQ